MRLLFPILGLPLLAACHTTSPQSWQVAASQFDFDWQLSGDPDVAPLQVFSSPHEIWLQFAPGQRVPAIFASTVSGEQPLAIQQRDPYIIAPGVWPALTLRGAHRVAHVRRSKAEPPQPVSPPISETIPAPLIPPRSIEADTRHAADSALSPPASAPGKTPLPLEIKPGAPVFFAGPPDLTLRAVLSRWALQAGWDFAPEHWALNADIPLQGQAHFEGDFKQVVRSLLRATELADRPLQPCFYANRVLRVVPLAQSCDRSAGAAT
ncbi:TcpQ domain-containing protein [Bordetella avium]|uniref:Type IV pilus assembly protein n=1 Tax=Bordetella avium (strain 197N) TaxID=360910 RepID=Q2KY57_BORA1|nr:TcpQ domain-containing protein [Bordetella avium]AZY49754.1 hypothetical protein C0J09_11810 [Bordetella avium]AZY53094.1 hypothetical protein C0J07_11735 [Bordetella avium]RIQ12564.1 hypothetical protein D0432_13115 [Bordetella avium]RIQ17654.1 hypothetical protein D0850_09305 [Bordetella avium]RIQ32310.1 hypothetical protein D0849_12350 [Bordetella avium]